MKNQRYSTHYPPASLTDLACFTVGGFAQLLPGAKKAFRL